MRYAFPVVLAGAILAVSCSVERAQPQPPDMPEPPGPPPFAGPPGGFRLPVPPLLEALDLNHDGELDADEIAKAASESDVLGQEQGR